MLNKKDRVFVSNVDPNTLMQTMQGALTQLGFQPTAPTGVGYMGIGAQLAYGVIPKVSLNVVPAQGGHMVDIDLRGDIEQTSLIIGVLLFVFFWPLAIVFAYLAYQGFEQHAAHVFGTLRNASGPYMAAPPGGAMNYPPAA